MTLAGNFDHMTLPVDSDKVTFYNILQVSFITQETRKLVAGPTGDPPPIWFLSHELSRQVF